MSDFRCKEHEHSSYIDMAQITFMTALDLEKTRHAVDYDEANEVATNSIREDIRNLLITAQTAALLEIAEQLRQLNEERKSDE